MTLETTIQAMFDHYPTLFKDRSDCLDHLFCIIGTEYDWQNGELVNTMPDETDKPLHPLKDGKAYQYNRTTLYEDAVCNARNNNMEIIIPYINQNLMHQYHHTERKKRWSFCSRNPDEENTVCLYKEQANLWNFPADIKPDWYGGIKECLQLLLEDGIITREDAETVTQCYNIMQKEKEGAAYVADTERTGSM